MEFDVHDLVWDDWNTEHVEKHGASRAEVEAVCYSKPIKYKESYKSRVLVIGPGLSDQLFTVVLGRVPYRPEADFYAFSARPADRKERAFYVAAKRSQTTTTDS